MEGRSVERLTAVDLFRSLLLLLASIVLSGLLDGKAGLGASGVEVTVVVHGLLQAVTLPAEDVVTVRGSATNVHGVNKWGRAIRRPQVLIGKLVDVPHELVHDLRKLDGMARWASTTTVSTSSLTISYVALVVRRVEVLAVPAGGEDDGLADELALGVLGDSNRVGATTGSATNEGALAG
jgi:hypothetical protein